MSTVTYLEDSPQFLYPAACTGSFIHEFKGTKEDEH